MGVFERQICTLLAERLREPRPLIQVLVGPRQVGKTTALKSALQGRGIYETADYPTPLSASMIHTWWDRALRAGDAILAIDEIQKLPGWSEVIKSRWDEKPHALKVILTGSSALLLEKGLHETLAGRFELIRVTHWTLDEARQAFGMDLQKYIEFGCYPGSAPLLHDIDRWASYIRDAIVEPVLGRDLLVLHPVDHPALLRQIFAIATGMPASIISLQKIVGNLQSRSSPATVQKYLDLLAQAFLVTPVEKLARNAVRARRSSPKLIVHDNALLRAFERPVGAKVDPARWGHYFENTVGARFVEAGWDVSYWKDRSDEIDFVVRGPNNEHWAIEVKSSIASERDLTSLKRFAAKNPAFQPCLVSAVDQEFPGVRTLPVESILSLQRR